MRNLIHGFEPLHYDKTLITEAVEKNAPLRLKAVLQRANSKNQNGRIYPKEILMREASNYQQFIKERRALGELDHPESSVVNLKNVSHNIVEMHFDGDDLVGELEILTTPSGNILRELLKNGIRLGISSRGLGSAEQMSEGTMEVQDDFQLICFDAVSNPSTNGAWISEGVSPTNIKYPIINNLIVDFLNEINEK